MATMLFNIIKKNYNVKMQIFSRSSLPTTILYPISSIVYVTSAWTRSVSRFKSYLVGEPRYMDVIDYGSMHSPLVSSTWKCSQIVYEGVNYP
jgi:hypothetical protein